MDQIVHVCGCGGEDGTWYARPDSEWICRRCGTRLRTVNITALEAENTALMGMAGDIKMLVDKWSTNPHWAGSVGKDAIYWCARELAAVVGKYEG